MNREKLPEYIFGFMPVLHRKLLRRHPRSVLSRQSMNLLHFINFHDGKPMKFYGHEMTISRPNMTKLVDGLIEEGLVVRRHCEQDRRVITLHITEQGRTMVCAYYDDMRAQILESTSGLRDEEIQALLDSFETIKRIFDKLDDHKKDGDSPC